MKWKLVTVLALTIFTLSFYAVANGQGVLDVAELVELKSIDSLRIVESPTPQLKLVATVINAGTRDVRIKNGRFTITMNPDGEAPADQGDNDALGGADSIQPKHPLVIGTSDIGMDGKPLEIPAGGEVRPVFIVPLPSDEKAKNDKIVKLINYIGMPSSNKSIVFRGKGSVGLNFKRGWAFQTVDEIELKYTPKLVRNVLLD